VWQWGAWRIGNESWGKRQTYGAMAQELLRELGCLEARNREDRARLAEADARYADAKAEIETLRRKLYDSSEASQKHSQVTATLRANNDKLEGIQEQLRNSLAHTSAAMKADEERYAVEIQNLEAERSLLALTTSHNTAPVPDARIVPERLCVHAPGGGCLSLSCPYCEATGW